MELLARGKDNFEVDRLAGDQVIDALPPLVARGARRFLVDAVHQLVTTYGVMQFIDIGSGLPADNTHEVAQPVPTDTATGLVGHVGIARKK